MAFDTWAVSDAYEAYMGRWSRRLAVAFIQWLAGPSQGRWLDVGCGTGALTEAILGYAEPAGVTGVDPSEQFVSDARARVRDPRATFQVGDAQSLPEALTLPDGQFDAVVSGLALNFVPDPHRAMAEFRRVAGKGSVIGAYVWDYADGMEMIRYFWEAATAVDPAAAALDEGRRFPLCRAEALHDLFSGAGLTQLSIEDIEVPTRFADFDDYWTPFLGGQGSAPGYVASLTEQHRQAVRDLLRQRLRSAADGSIQLTARAWAVRGQSGA